MKDPLMVLFPPLAGGIRGVRLRKKDFMGDLSPRGERSPLLAIPEIFNRESTEEDTLSSSVVFALLLFF